MPDAPDRPTPRPASGSSDGLARPQLRAPQLIVSSNSGMQPSAYHLTIARIFRLFAMLLKLEMTKLQRVFK